MTRTCQQISLMSTAIVLLGLSLSTMQAIARPIPDSNRPLIISQSFRPPSRGTAPPSAGGATRGSSCLKGSAKPLTSLLPQTRVGLTYSSNPTFYWYVPQSSAKTARFLLLSGDDTDIIYETSLILPGKSGIVSFTLPTKTAALAVDKQYHWYLIVGCNPIDQSANPAVEGWVERVSPEATISSQLQKADAKSRAKIYAENGIWHEAVTTLATLRKADSSDNDAIAGWNQLLNSVNLDAITTEPLLDVTISQN